MQGVVIYCVVALLVVACCGRPLGLKDGAPVDDKFVEQVSQLEQDSLQFVANRVVSQLHISSEEAEALRLNFLRWMSLNFLINSTSSAATAGPFVPSEQVDEFWHNFILYTKKYQVWCFKHFGYFIHHVPEEESTELAVAAHNTDWKKTAALMRDLYDVNWLNQHAEDGTCGSCHSLESAGCGSCKSGKPDAACGSCGTSGSCKTTASQKSDAACGSCGTSGSCKTTTA